VSFKKGDWVLIGAGKKAHQLIQTYNGLAPRCTPMSHSNGVSYGGDVLPEEMKDGSSSAKCKRCLK